MTKYFLFLLFIPSVAFAGSDTQTLTVAIRQKLTIVFTPTNPVIDCTTPPGTVVSALSITGGNGKPVSYALTGGDTVDFALSGVNVVVGTNGISSATCGTTANVTVTATQ